MTRVWTRPINLYPRILECLAFERQSQHCVYSTQLCSFSCPTSAMATKLPQKRILGEATNTRRNIPATPASAKKRKLEPVSSPAARFKSSQNGPKGKPGSSQPSQFETEVLEKMTQDMAGLKKSNSEMDQEWARPSLATFRPGVDKLCFQQIEAEEGTLDGRAAVKLFGVTEVSLGARKSNHKLTMYSRLAILLCFTSRTFFTISTSLPRSLFHPTTVKASRPSSTPKSHNTNQPSTQCR